MTEIEAYRRLYEMGWMLWPEGWRSAHTTKALSTNEAIELMEFIDSTECPEDRFPRPQKP